MSDSKSTAPPRISVVMAVYNGERYLVEAVESILNQTFRDFEYIIINDGSTDDTAKILDRFAAQDPRIHVVHQPPFPRTAVRPPALSTVITPKANS